MRRIGPCHTIAMSDPARSLDRTIVDRATLDPTYTEVRCRGRQDAGNELGLARFGETPLEVMDVEAAELEHLIEHILLLQRNIALDAFDHQFA